MNARDCSAGLAGGRVAEIRTGRGWLARALGAVLVWQERARQRHMLAELDDRMLADIGLSRAEIHWEVSKRPWQA